MQQGFISPSPHPQRIRVPETSQIGHQIARPLMVQLGLAPRNNTITSTTLHHQRLAGILTDASHQAAPLPMPAPNIVPQAPLGAVTPRCLSRYRPASLPEGWHFLSFKQVGHITMVQ